MSNTNIKKYSKIEILGKGSFGTVYLVRHKDEKKKYALKKIKLHGIPRAEKESTKMELKLLQTLRHPGIVGYKESFEVNKKTSRHALCIVMQLCDGGELKEYLDKVLEKRKHVPQHIIMNYFVQMTLALEYMHRHRVLHRDIKTQNIFLLGNGRLVLGDLGVCKSFTGNNNKEDFTKTSIGTP